MKLASGNFMLGGDTPSTPDQKYPRLIPSRRNHTLFEEDWNGFMERFLTQDGCPVHHYKETLRSVKSSTVTYSRKVHAGFICNEDNILFCRMQNILFIISRRAAPSAENTMPNCWESYEWLSSLNLVSCRPLFSLAARFDWYLHKWYPGTAPQIEVRKP